MVKIILRLVLFAVLCGLGFWLWTILFPSPEKIVLKKIAALAATASVKPGDSNLTRAGKAVKLAGFFALNAEVVVHLVNQDEHTISGRDEIKERALAGLAQISSLSVKFLDATAQVGPDKLTATVSCTANIAAGERRDFSVQELRFQFQKIDGDWLITRVETVRTLQ